MIWRRFRDMVVDISPIFITADNLETGGMWVLAVLDHPQPATFIEFQVQRLGNLWFAEHDVDPQISRRSDRKQCRVARQTTPCA